jgi:hypothetical protein
MKKKLLVTGWSASPVGINLTGVSLSTFLTNLDHFTIYDENIKQILNLNITINRLLQIDIIYMSSGSGGTIKFSNGLDKISFTQYYFANHDNPVSFTIGGLSSIDMDNFSYGADFQISIYSLISDN